MSLSTSFFAVFAAYRSINRKICTLKFYRREESRRVSSFKGRRWVNLGTYKKPSEESLRGLGLILGCVVNYQLIDEVEE
jgi:hypothetical protein